MRAPDLITLQLDEIHRMPSGLRAVVTDAVASQVLTVMAACGMYNACDEWLLRVRLPARSGVSGAVVAASPGQVGIGCYSHRLDSRGGSVRAVAACRELPERFGLRLMRHRTGRCRRDVGCRHRG